MSEPEHRWWAYGDYTGDDCPNCNRTRLMKCEDNAKRERIICEKCSWEPAVNDYCYEAIGMGEDLIVVGREPLASTTAKPSMRLRWVPKSIMQAMDLKLQQAWEIVHYDGAHPLRIEIEWRDIPVERG